MDQLLTVNMNKAGQIFQYQIFKYLRAEVDCQLNWIGANLGGRGTVPSVSFAFRDSFHVGL